MKYVVMYRGHIKHRTDDIDEARATVEEIGDTAYIQYGSRAIAEYQESHESYRGEQE